MNEIEAALRCALDRKDQLDVINAAGTRYYYSPEQEFDDINKKMVIDEMIPFIRPGTALEFGYTNNIWTNALLQNGISHVTVIEAADNHIAKAQTDFGYNRRVTIEQTLFEEYAPKSHFDTILMSGVIKHVPNDCAIVAKAKQWLAPGGVIIATTPNCRSFHRRLGAAMGFESAPDRHNARDREVFNVHLYDRYSWAALFRSAGYEVLVNRGVFFKPFSTRQMMQLTQNGDGSSIMKGLRVLGEELQDYAWYLLLVAKPAAP